VILLRPKQTGAADSLNEFGSSKGLAAARGWGAAGRGRGLRSSRTRAALLTTATRREPALWSAARFPPGLVTG